MCVCVSGGGGRCVWERELEREREREREMYIFMVLSVFFILYHYIYVCVCVCVCVCMCTRACVCVMDMWQSPRKLIQRRRKWKRRRKHSQWKRSLLLSTDAFIRKYPARLQVYGFLLQNSVNHLCTRLCCCFINICMRWGLEFSIEPFIGHRLQGLFLLGLFQNIAHVLMNIIIIAVVIHFYSHTLCSSFYVSSDCPCDDLENCIHQTSSY